MVKNKSFVKSTLYFVVIVFFAVMFITLSFLPQKKKEATIAQEAPTQVFKRKPVYTGNGEYPVLSAQSVYAIDANSGEVLYEKDPEKHSLPASTAKIVTALVALEYYPMDKTITVENIGVEGQKMGLVVGESINVEDLLYGLLVYSANDAAEALAAGYPGGRELFISTMNLKANEYGLTDSYFVHPAGLDGVGQYTTAEDLIKISQVAMQNDFVAKAVATEEKTVRSVDGKYEHKLTNINQLLGKVDGVLGIKTGWTENARENLVTYIQRDGREVYIALLGSQDRFGETTEVIEWIFDNYSWITVSEVSP